MRSLLNRIAGGTVFFFCITVFATDAFCQTENNVLTDPVCVLPDLPEGEIGYVIACFGNDPENSIQPQLVEALQTSFENEGLASAHVVAVSAILEDMDSGTIPKGFAEKSGFRLLIGGKRELDLVRFYTVKVEKHTFQFNIDDAHQAIPQIDSDIDIGKHAEQIHAGLESGKHELLKSFVGPLPEGYELQAEGTGIKVIYTELPREPVGEPFFLVHYLTACAHLDCSEPDYLQAIDAAQKASKVEPERDSNRAVAHELIANVHLALIPIIENRENAYRDAIEQLEAGVLLSEEGGKPLRAAAIHHQLGDLYTKLRYGERSDNFKKAIEHCQKASDTYAAQPELVYRYALVQNDLGKAYGQSPNGDRTENLKRAIECHKTASQTLKKETHPLDYGRTEYLIGNAKMYLPDGDREQNLDAAMKHFEEALSVLTPEIAPLDYAWTQHSIGFVYFTRPAEGPAERERNIREAIKRFNIALEYETAKDAPQQYGETHNNLGFCYTQLQSGDRRNNLLRSIRHFENALKVRTRKSDPYGYAKCLTNKGLSLCALPGPHHERNLKQGVICFRMALDIFTKTWFPREHQETTEHLKRAEKELQKYGI